VVGTLNLVSEMLKNEVNNLVFSSTAAIFGNPITEKIAEDHPKNPANPYGQSKLMVEKMLQDVCLVNDFNATCLRYFNAAGAHESGEIGEAHDPETHLIPNILKSALSDKNILKVFGDDYPTEDGTCVRDYVHVTDLARAHLLALENMKNKKGFAAFNLGNGDGFSVLDIIKNSQRITDVNFRYEIDERREGDPAILVADNKLAMSSLGWDPKWGNISEIIKSAWLWHAKQIC
jgi:UDP-glucose 4-epimerase